MIHGPELQDPQGDSASEHEVPAATARVEVTCPLCGYDQSGAIAAWRSGNESPLRGRCSECGLDWHWGDLLHPAKQLPHWFAENPRRWAVPVLVSTWRRALRPRRLWDGVLVTMPVHRGRLVMFAAVALLAAYVVAGGMSAWSSYAFGGWGLVIGGAAQSRAVQATVAAVFPFRLGLYPDVRAVGVVTLLALVWMLLMPMPFLVLRDSFSRIRVRRVHLLRIGVYSLAPLPLIMLALALLRHGALLVSRNIGAWTTDPTLYMTWWRVTYSVVNADWIVLLIVAAWLAVFWLRAIRLYLHLPNPRAVVAMIMLASLLAAVAIVAYLPGSSLAQQVGSWFV